MGALKIIIDVILALVIAVLVFLGVKRGFVKSFFKTTKLFFVILLTILIGSFAVGICRDMIIEPAFTGQITDRLVAYAEQSDGEFNVEAVNKNVPAFVQKLISMREVEESIPTISGNDTDVARAIGVQIEGMVIDLTSNITGYVIAFVLSFIFCTIAIKIIEKFWELPTLGWINHLSGILWGVANSYLVTSFIVCIVALVFGVEFIEGTALTQLIYKIGLFTL